MQIWCTAHNSAAKALNLCQWHDMRVRPHAAVGGRGTAWKGHCLTWKGHYLTWFERGSAWFGFPQKSKFMKYTIAALTEWNWITVRQGGFKDGVGAMGAGEMNVLQLMQAAKERQDKAQEMLRLGYRQASLECPGPGAV